MNERSRTLTITEKGGLRVKRQISKEGIQAIREYISRERGEDDLHWQSAALFLSAKTVKNAKGRLSPQVARKVWYEACRLAGGKGRTPHSVRHAMGVHIIKKTGNPRAAQRQLGHKNSSTTMQYMQFTKEELQEVLDGR